MQANMLILILLRVADILEVWCLRVKDVKFFTQDNIANKWLRRRSNPHLNPVSMYLINKLCLSFIRALAFFPLGF